MWPKSKQFVARYKVQDLVPEKVSRAVFVGESPHRDEVAPESPSERSPFRGVAGREWWSELAKFLSHPLAMRPVPPRATLMQVCEELEIAVMNAVQYPLDPKIMLHQGRESAPVVQIGFEKGVGEQSYKAVYRQDLHPNPVESAIADLASRLTELKGAPAQIVCLGNDSRWFVERAVQEIPVDAPLVQKPVLTIPHPSSWWRNSAYRARAVEVLGNMLVRRKERPGRAPEPPIGL